MTLTHDGQLQLSFAEPAPATDEPGLGEGSAALGPCAPSGAAGAGSRLLLTTREAARSLRISRSKLYQLLADGSIESVRIGASRRVPADALTEFVARLRAPSTEQSTDHHAASPPGDHRREDH